MLLEEHDIRYAKTSLSSGDSAAVRVRIVAGRKASWSEIDGGDGWTVPFRYSFFMTVFHRENTKRLCLVEREREMVRQRERFLRFEGLMRFYSQERRNGAIGVVDVDIGGEV